MYQPTWHRLFDKDIKRDKTSGNHKQQDFELLKLVITQLCAAEPLAAQHKDHLLSGEWSRCRECHIKNDWLLIYRIDEAENSITFLRLGTHAQLFKKFK